MVWMINRKSRIFGGQSFVGPVMVALLLTGCGAAPTSLVALNASYERALERTASLAVVLVPGTREEQRAFQQVAVYFAGMTPAAVASQTSRVYAPTAYLNDTLVGIEGAGAIETYFEHTLQNSQGLKVEFLDRAPVGIDWYVRWRMTVLAKDLNDGEPVLTFGVTQFRFDERGRVLIHKDFWDAGTGLYEQIPVLRWVIGRLRAVIETGGAGK